MPRLANRTGRGRKQSAAPVLGRPGSVLPPESKPFRFDMSIQMWRFPCWQRWAPPSRTNESLPQQRRTEYVSDDGGFSLASLLRSFWRFGSYFWKLNSHKCTPTCGGGTLQEKSVFWVAELGWFSWTDSKMHKLVFYNTALNNRD